MLLFVHLSSSNTSITNTYSVCGGRENNIMLKNLTSYLALLVYANCTWNGLPKHVTSAASTSLQSMSEDLSFLTVLPITEKCLHSESCHFGHYNHLLIALLCTK